MPASDDTTNVISEIRCWDSTDGRESTTMVVQTDMRFGHRMVTAYTVSDGLPVLNADGARELGEALIKAADSLAERRLPGV